MIHRFIEQLTDRVPFVALAELVSTALDFGEVRRRLLQHRVCFREPPSRHMRGAR
jgi:hypothetical protein